MLSPENTVNDGPPSPPSPSIREGTATVIERHPSPTYLLGALIESCAPHQWALDTASAYRQVLDTHDGQRISRLQWALWSLFMKRGYTDAALCIITLPSDHNTFTETALRTFNDLEGAA